MSIDFFGVSGDKKRKSAYQIEGLSHRQIEELLLAHRLLNISTLEKIDEIDSDKLEKLFRINPEQFSEFENSLNQIPKLYVTKLDFNQFYTSLDVEKIKKSNLEFDQLSKKFNEIHAKIDSSDIEKIKKLEIDKFDQLQSKINSLDIEKIKKSNLEFDQLYNKFNEIYAKVDSSDIEKIKKLEIHKFDQFNSLDIENINHLLSEKEALDRLSKITADQLDKLLQTPLEVKAQADNFGKEVKNHLKTFLKHKDILQLLYEGIVDENHDKFFTTINSFLQFKGYLPKDQLKQLIFNSPEAYTKFEEIFKQYLQTDSLRKSLQEQVAEHFKLFKESMRVYDLRIRRIETQLDIPEPAPEKDVEDE